MNIEHALVVSLMIGFGNLIGMILCMMRLYSVDVEISAMKKSTHKIQWMPIDKEWAESETKVNQAFERDQGHPDDLQGL